MSRSIIFYIDSIVRLVTIALYNKINVAQYMRDSSRKIYKNIKKIQNLHLLSHKLNYIIINNLIKKARGCFLSFISSYLYNNI